MEKDDKLSGKIKWDVLARTLPSTPEAERTKLRDLFESLGLLHEAERYVLEAKACR